MCFCISVGDVYVFDVHADLGRCDPVTRPLSRVDDTHRNMGGAIDFPSVRRIRTGVRSFNESRSNTCLLPRRRILRSQRSAIFSHLPRRLRFCLCLSVIRLLQLRFDFDSMAFGASVPLFSAQTAAGRTLGWQTNLQPA